ncbi:hypothetical protein SNE40_002813 [Patella caerulea]|uniref:DUF4371 domain-containing protein n=1 Tax=Patella caerulea TaxID=87958 RepID=A0AAN8KGQ4_PATCE
MGKIYCYTCKLFGGAGPFANSGFCDWKHANRAIDLHERSNEHCTNTIRLSERMCVTGRVDKELVKQASDMANYWKEVPRRCVSVISFLAERGLPFRGSDETAGSVHNGNYLGMLELLAQYDPFLAEHLQRHSNECRSHTNYLSSTICEELVTRLGKQVEDSTIDRVKKSNYYSISVDSTPDISHVDQLTVIFRYMEGDSPVERYMTFLPNAGHICQEQADGQSAVHSSRSAAAFFDLVEQIYNFFTASTSRFTKLSAVLKRLIMSVV